MHAKTAARCEPQFLFLHGKFGYGGQKTDKKEAVIIITITKQNHAYVHPGGFKNPTDINRLVELLPWVVERLPALGFYRIVYISPESVQAYLDSEEEDTFFGYGTRELTEAFGYGTALAYTENGFQSAKIIEENESYNWKSFLTKVGIGCGVLIVGAILAPVTGGASFGCALITATKITVGASLCAGLGTLAIETAMGLHVNFNPEIHIWNIIR